MRPRSAMWDHQKAAVERAQRLPLVALLDVGYGKTATTLTALNDQGLLPALVVAPATLVETDGWGAEAAQWQHLARLRVVPVAGTADKREKLLRGEGDIFTLSYDNLDWLADVLGDGGKLSKFFKAVVFDEVQRMKHPGTKRFRRMRARVNVPAIGLTATPVGNHLLDLWGEMFIVAGATPLGPTFTDYRDKYFEPVDYYRHVWRLKCCPKCRSSRDGCKPPNGPRPYLDCACHQAQLADIRRRIAPFVFTAPVPPKVVGVPPVFVNPIRVPMPPAVERLEAQLVADLWATLPSGAELEALSLSTVAQKRRQIAGGVVYKGEAGDEGEWEVVHTAKLDALDDLLDGLQGQPALVYYWYHHEAVAIKRRLGRRHWADMRADPARAVALWNSGQLEVLLAQPASGGEGLNLQAGGHHVVWYTLPWQAAMLHQGTGRVARPGQRAPRVDSHWLLCGPMDDRVAAVLRGKLDTQSEIVKPLDVEDLI